MGSILSSWITIQPVGLKTVKLLMLGLDAAGKTTILYRFHSGEVILSAPTIGFNLEAIDYKKQHYTIWDIGGQDQLRILWRHYYDSTDGLIFVVDSNDRERMDDAAEELEKLASEDSLKGVPFLVIANKQDLPEAMNIAELKTQLRLEKTLSNHKWTIQPACATSGEGLYDSLEWFSTTR